MSVEVALSLIAVAVAAVIVIFVVALVAIREWLDRRIGESLMGDDHEMIAGDVP